MISLYKLTLGVASDFIALFHSSLSSPALPSCAFSVIYCRIAPSPAFSNALSALNMPDHAALVEFLNYQFGQSLLRQDEDAPQSGLIGGSIQTDDPMRLLDSDDARAQAHVPERAFHEIELNSQQPFDPPLCTTRAESRKGARKRDRDRNWTEEETAVLVECKRTAFHERGSPFRKLKSNATNWEAISQELRNNPVTRASEKTGDQCRLRWDTLIKSHRTIKGKCVQKGKGYAELTEEDLNELKLATTLDKEWYEVIDTISCKGRSQKQSSSVGDYANLESIMASVVPVDQLVGSPNAPTDPDHLHQLFFEGSPAGSARNFLHSSPSTRDPTGRPERRKSSLKQIAIPGFTSMNMRLRGTLLDLILGAHFLKERWLEPEGYFAELEEEILPLSCRWLSIVQNRSCYEIYNDVNMLVTMKLVHISARAWINDVWIDQSRLLVFEKFVKKVILLNPVYDTHLSIRAQTMSTLEAFSVSQQIRVLKLERCGELEKANFRGLRKLRFLYILKCPKLVEVIGWKFLRELAWLEVSCCSKYQDYPGLEDLPSLKEFRFDRGLTECPQRYGLDVSQCVRLRRLEIWNDDGLEESGDLSSLRCLETLSFKFCTYLSTIAGLSGLHALTSLNLKVCENLRRLPDIGHMKELVCINISETALKEIRGIEKLGSLKTLDCSYSKLKRLPDLHHLPELRKVLLEKTPLIENDSSSFYFDKSEVLYNREESGHVDVSDVSDTEENLSDSEASFSDDSLSCDDAD